ncbi:hypothetical protein L873DRAFT_1803017 [Choiromyces venosus 120613-1]|uniref:F-box domain-containing protein n=1 Tax=Choiromyces venosus 120613-1 TaxID=1336337 RepID=A0A3N4K039_9PEZI|nr:hypothetical protein L873DRAFT_1803017 [Choiromyces venosus 120613-1]
MGFVNPGRSSTRLNKTFGKRYNKPPPSPPPQRRRKTLSCSSGSSSIRSTPSSSSTTPSPNSPCPQSPFAITTFSPLLLPPAHPRDLPTLQTLPPELLQRIFLLGNNPRLPATSLCLSRALSAPILRHEYIHMHHGTNVPTELLAYRFFTPQFLHTHETKYNSTLSFAEDTHLPPHRYSTELLRLLLLRGGTLAVEDADEWTAVLREGVQDSDEEFVRALLDEAKVKPDEECLGLAIEKGWVAGMEALVEMGDGVGLGGRGVWEKALEVGQEGKGAGLEFLLERGCPPAGLLGRVGEVVRKLRR